MSYLVGQRQLERHPQHLVASIEVLSQDVVLLELVGAVQLGTSIQDRVSSARLSLDRTESTGAQSVSLIPQRPRPETTACGDVRQ